LRGQPDIRQFATRGVGALLGRLVFEIRHALHDHDPEAVHDLRVTIRRFSESLRTFRSLLPRAEVRKVRARLRRVMKLSAEVRNRDIAAGLFDASGLPLNSTLRRRQAEQREQAFETLQEELRRLQRRSFSARWRERLGLKP
jgi:CHAD domain-containing protein